MLGLIGASFAPAVAALPKYNYVAYSGGSLISALGTTISSDLTATSAISGAAVPNASTNQVAVVDASPLARLGVIETSTRAAEFGDGVRITSKARTAGVNLLDGLITADAVETTNITTGSPATGITATANTRFVNLKVVGVQLPVDIPNNYKITNPGVAVIGLNVAITQENDGVVQSTGYGLGVWLLQSQATAPLGSSIILNPTYAGLAPPVRRPAPGRWLRLRNPGTGQGRLGSHRSDRQDRERRNPTRWHGWTHLDQHHRHRPGTPRAEGRCGHLDDHVDGAAGLGGRHQHQPDRRSQPVRRTHHR